jgi:signal transduction histidine kinase
LYYRALRILFVFQFAKAKLHGKLPGCGFVVPAGKKLFVKSRKISYNGKQMAHEELRAAIVAILQEKRESILDEYYYAYCRHISEVDRKRRTVDELTKICMPVRARFTVILDRFISLLKTENLEYCYDLSESERDTEYALRFTVTGQHRKLGSHDIIKETEGFVELVKRALLEKNDPLLSAREGQLMIVLSKLTYIFFEDLWVSSVAGFRSQHGLIQQLLSKLIRVHEAERQNFWRDIHDDFLQVLAVITLKLEIVADVSDKNIEVMKGEIERLKRLVSGSTLRLRNLCKSFNLSWFEVKGLAFSLKVFVDVFQEEFGIPVELRMHGTREKIDGFLGVTLLRIVQEALYNVGKHSKATHATVDLRILNGRIFVTVQDDGTGFEVNKTVKRNVGLEHLGLIFMKERVRLLHGSLEIVSTKNQGTRIEIQAPFTENPSSDIASDARKVAGK